MAVKAFAGGLQVIIESDFAFSPIRIQSLVNLSRVQFSRTRKMIKKVLVLLLIGHTASEAQNREKSDFFECDIIRMKSNVIFCLVSYSTVINRNDFRINQLMDDEIGWLDFRSFLTKVEFLPIFINETYPRLQVVSASNCAIKEIRKENFVNLHYMTIIWLEGNQIEKIKSDTFDGLWRLFQR